MTVLLYAYKKALDDGIELRYSLRSLQKNFQPADGELQLMLVGDAPPTWCMPDEWVRGNPSDDKVFNMAYNVRAAVARLQSDFTLVGESQPVYYLSDDYFLLDPTDSIIATDAGSLRMHVATCERNLRAGHWYTEVLARTLVHLEDRVDSPMSYELHRPMPLDVDHAVEALDGIPEGVFWRTWYANEIGLESVTARDGRFVGKTWPLGVPWISTEERAWADWAGRRISKLFPEPSRWER